MVTNSVSRSRWGESVGAISPFFCSSKSLVSPNGRPPRACLSTSKVNFDGALPLGWKCPAKGAAAPCARRGTVIQHQMTTDRERCAHCWKCLHKLSSGCHRPLLHKRPVGTAVPGSSWESLARGGVRQDARSRNSINRGMIANGSENVLFSGWGNLRRGGAVPPGAIYMDWPVMIGDWSVP